MRKIKRIDPKVFREFGYLQEVNRLFLHPLGMALEVIVDDETGKVSLGGIWDYRDDPEGILFEDNTIDKVKAAMVQNQWHEKGQIRIKKLGYIIQPIMGIK